MEEFVFGTLATDELKLLHHRVARQGIQHAHHITPRDPKPGQPVTLSVQTGPDFDAEHVVCYYTLDGSVPAGARGEASNGRALGLERVETLWDTAAFGYLTRWQGVIPAQPEGAVVRYRVGAWAGDGVERFADYPNLKDIAEGAVIDGKRRWKKPGIDPKTGGDLFTYHVDRLAPPAWARAAVIYHIFVDRFYPGDGKDWLQTDDLTGFCGGTLWGVRDKLDYIAGLGADCIWLSPIFPSPSYHGYDAVKFRSVSERLGGDAALRALVEAAHARGMRIILDLTCNHISHEHPIFQEVLGNPDSACRDWFTFDSSRAGYRTFFGYHKMPQLNADNLDARRWMIDIALYWLREFDVDGFRLDHANGPGPGFWSDYWAACKAVKPDSFHFGEVVEPPDVLRTYAGRIDGCLDFIAEDALRKTFAAGRMTGAEYARFIARHLDYFPENFVMPTFLDNHDMDRFLYVAGGDKDALRRAVAAQMQLPGPPIIYYGTEVGMTQPSTRHGAKLELSRAPMLWGDAQDKALLADYKALVEERRARRS
ncbi:MAG: alpha-amylase [Anaerolineae bacterium]|nr:alpha-amylase [Anaerolineae bacterium]